MHEAQFWEALDDQKAHCHLCRFHCVIAVGRRGRCGVRENQDGILYSLVYGRSIAEQVDPIEKKPLFHFYPGSRSLSIATVGCNFRCLHCQNADISQWPHERPGIPGSSRRPDQIVADAVEQKCLSIAYTYTEPTIYFEYAYDTAVQAREAGVRNVFVSNGYMTPAPLEKIAPYLDAANIDLKGFSDKFYRDVTGASLQGVLECLKDYHRLGIWIEVTTLVIPGMNDSDEDLNGVAEFIAGELGVNVPWHVSAFHPTYKMLDRPPTRVESLLKAREAGWQAGLQHIYLGNVPGTDGENTLCPGCGSVVIRRQGFRLQDINLQKGRCGDCGHNISGVALG